MKKIKSISHYSGEKIMNKLLKKAIVLCTIMLFLFPITTFALSCNWRKVERGNPVTTAYGKVTALGGGYTYYTDYYINAGTPVGVMAEVKVVKHTTGEEKRKSGVKSNGYAKTVSVGFYMPDDFAHHYYDHHTNMAR